jgi:hypothetical protein
MYRECARSWAWRYLQNIKTPRDPSAELGTEVDEQQLQPYLRDGRPFDESKESGKIAKALLPYLPAPKTPGMVLQRHFVFPSPTFVDGEHIGLGYQGYQDLWLPDSAQVPDMPGGAPFVGDFKTTSSISKWAKTEATLKTDVQAVLYAMEAMFTAKSRVVDLSWMYAQTTGVNKKRERVYLRVVADDVVPEFQKIEATATELLELRKTNPHPKTLPLPRSYAACRAYGGCPYESHCALTSTELFTLMSAEEEENMSPEVKAMLARLDAQKSGAQAPSSPVSPSPDLTPAPLTSAPSIAEPIVVLGINPPEKDLPLIVAAPAEPPRKRGRPAKAPTPETVEVAAEIIPPNILVVAFKAAAKAFFEVLDGAA